MSEPSYPVSCRFCTKLLYGPVKYCPYCGSRLESAPGVEPVGGPQDTGIGPEYRDRKAGPDVHPRETSPEPTATIHQGKPIDRPKDILSPEAEREIKGEPPPETPILRQPAISSKWTWILMAIVVISFLVYQGFHSKDNGAFHKPDSQPSFPPVSKPPSSKPTTTNHAKREAARVLALEALRQGTILSVTVSKLPKLEKVLQAAQKLQEISPRYQPQVTTAKMSLNDTVEKKDKSLMAYLSKVLELGRYSSDQISYALETMCSGDLTPRERTVVELLANHLKSSQNNVKPDPEKWLSDFTERFNIFID